MCTATFSRWNWCEHSCVYWLLLVLHLLVILVSLGREYGWGWRYVIAWEVSTSRSSPWSVSMELVVQAKALLRMWRMSAWTRGSVGPYTSLVGRSKSRLRRLRSFRLQVWVLNFFWFLDWASQLLCRQVEAPWLLVGTGVLESIRVIRHSSGRIGLASLISTLLWICAMNWGLTYAVASLKLLMSRWRVSLLLRHVRWNTLACVVVLHTWYFWFLSRFTNVLLWGNHKPLIVGKVDSAV